MHTGVRGLKEKEANFIYTKVFYLMWSFGDLETLRRFPSGRGPYRNKGSAPGRLDMEVYQDLGNSRQMPDPCADKNLTKIRICLRTVRTNFWENFGNA